MIRTFIAIFMLAPAGTLAQGSFGNTTDAGPTAEGARKAILIGINEYQDESFSALAYARNDAEGLGRVLADSAYGGFETVDLVVSGNLGAKPIVDALVAWSATLAPEDEALIYFSAHGTRFIDERNRSRVFLAAADTRRDDPVHTGIALDALQELLESLPAQRRILIIDACFTGDGKTSEADAEGAARALIDAKLPFSDKVADKEARLFATTYGRPALESDTLGHGVYTAHLIDSLSERFDEADINQDNVVSVSEAHDYARDRTMEGTGQLQVPMVFYKIVGKEDLLLSGDPNSRERVEMAMVSAYEGPQQGLRMFVDGEEKGVFPRTVLVEPGARRVEFKNLEGKTVDSGRVIFRKEGIYNVTNIRDGLNGGRHLLSFGYAHMFLRGALQETDGPVPSVPGFRFAYSFRFPSKVPLLRRLGLVVDVVAGGIAQRDTNQLGLSPPTAVLDVGAGPIIRFDLPYMLFSIQPRFSVAAILRNNVVEGSGWLNWLFGTIGSNFAVGFRPVNRFSVQFQYLVGGYNVGLQGGGEAKVELLHRFGGTVEIGF